MNVWGCAVTKPQSASCITIAAKWALLSGSPLQINGSVKITAYPGLLNYTAQRRVKTSANSRQRIPKSSMGPCNTFFTSFEIVMLAESCQLTRRSRRTSAENCNSATQQARQGLRVVPNRYRNQKAQSRAHQWRGPHALTVTSTMLLPPDPNNSPQGRRLLG